MFRTVKAFNFFSFREGVEVSFELGKGQTSKAGASNAVGIFGANGSGKSNLLRIFSTLAEICCHSANANPDEISLVKPFFNLNNEVAFHIEFSDGDTLYRYDIDLTPESIISEVFHRKAHSGNWKKIIDRKGEELVYTHQDFKELESLGSIRGSASIISIAHYLGKYCITPLYEKFNLIDCNIEGRGTKQVLNYQEVSKFYQKYPEFFSFVRDIIVKADLGISDIIIESYTSENGDKTYFPCFVHKVGETEQLLHYRDESVGTQTLYSTLVQYAAVLMSGGILVIDEIEINLHPLLYPLLLDLFLDQQKNIQNAQILFTTHREDLFDILGKYRSIITDKKENESCAYRLDNLSEGVIRNDRPITPLYLKGLLGGVPLISELLSRSGKSDLNEELTNE